MNIHAFIKCQVWCYPLVDTQVLDLKKDLYLYSILSGFQCQLYYGGQILNIFPGESNSDSESSISYEMWIGVDKNKEQPKYAPSFFLSFSDQLYLVDHTAIEELVFPKSCQSFSLSGKAPQSPPSASIKFPNVTILIKGDSALSDPPQTVVKKLASAAVCMNKVLKCSLLSHEAVDPHSPNMPSSKVHSFLSTNGTPCICLESRAPVTDDSQNLSLEDETMSTLDGRLHSWMATLHVSQRLTHPVVDSHDLKKALLIDRHGSSSDGEFILVSCVDLAALCIHKKDVYSY